MSAFAGPLRVVRFDDVLHFRSRAMPVVMAHEAENNLLLGALSHVPANRLEFREANALLCTVESRFGSVLAVGTMRPPQALVLTRAAPGAIDALVDDLARTNVAVPGVVAPDETARTFARAWGARTGAGMGTRKALGVHQLDAVIPPPHPPGGTFRMATPDDIEPLIPWADALHREIGERDAPPSRDALTSRVRERRLFLWCDPRPVSMASLAGPTPNGIRINLVYTPPEFRRRGYASACVATLSQHALDAGRKFCFLFTDLANPTSNKIYRSIGYQHVCDFRHIHFDRGA